MYEQFISSNRNELAEVISIFNELNAVRQKNLCLYLDSQGWEVYDQEFCLPILRSEFKHIKTLTDEMRHIRQSIIEASMIKYLPTPEKPNRVQSWAVRHLQKIYKEHVNYFIYGRKKKENNH